MTSRRSFLRTLVAAVAGVAIDPERLLWQPGAKTFFLPTPIPGTYGAIERASFSFWRSNQIYFLSPSLIDSMRLLVGQVQNAPLIVLAGSPLQAPPDLRFRGVPIVYDRSLPEDVSYVRLTTEANIEVKKGHERRLGVIRDLR